MDSSSSDEETIRMTPPLKRPRVETDEEDFSSALSSSETDTGADTDAGVDTDTDVDERYQVMPFNMGVGGPRRAGSALRRRRTGHERADDFVATMRLMSEIEMLRRQRDELVTLHYARRFNTGSRDALINTTIEYYDTFREGFRGPRVPEMVQFFNTRLDLDLFAYGGGGLGLDTWIEQWRRYTHIFPSTSMRLRSLNVVELVDASDDTSRADPTVATCLINTHGILDGIVTRQAVCTVFPHLRGREDLIHKLVGKRLNLPMNLRFYFNSSGRVIRYDFDGDYFQALSNFEDVGVMELTQIMEQVAIGENSTVPPPVEVVEEDAAAPAAS